MGADSGGTNVDSGISRMVPDRTWGMANSVKSCLNSGEVSSPCWRAAARAGSSFCEEEEEEEKFRQHIRNIFLKISNIPLTFGKHSAENQNWTVDTVRPNLIF